MTEYDVVVVGSCVIDLICYAKRLPKSGETLLGKKFETGNGGKGANQCVAAAKLGAKTAMVGRLGNDSFGQDYLKSLKELSVSVDHVQKTEKEATGMAQITVSETGENHIVIVPGANNTLSIEDVRQAETIIHNAKVVICQMEIPPQSTLETLMIKSKSDKGISIFNAAPADSNLDPLLYSLPNIFCVNENEAEVCTGVRVTNIEEAKKAGAVLQQKGCQEVIVTLGAQGAVYINKDSSKIVHIPSTSVVPIDTTGAGDSFIGALAFFIARYPNLVIEEKIRRACSVASMSVQKRGTQSSFPTSKDLPKDIL